MGVIEDAIFANEIERARLLASAERLTDADLVYSLGEGLTVAVALAYLAFWDRRSALLLEQWE